MFGLSCAQIAYMEEFHKQRFANYSKVEFEHGYASNVNNLTWLECKRDIPSNKTGWPFGLNNGELFYVWVGNSNLVQYDLTIYWHEGDEVNLTSLDTRTITNTQRSHFFTAADFGLVSVPKDKQIAWRVTDVPGSKPENVAVHTTIIGTT